MIATGSSDPIAVIGSGPSGLAAAWCLRERGHPVTVFERDAIPGGKMRTIRRDGYLIEEGPTVMSRNYVAILSLAREAGMADQIIEASAVFGFPRNGVIHTFDAGRILRDGLTTPLLSRRDKAMLARLGADCLRHRTALKRGELTALARLDVESGETYARRFLSRDAVDYLVDPALRGLCSSSPDELSALDVLYCFNNFLGIPRAYAFRDGMGSYPATIARSLDMRYEATAVAVEERPDEVRVDWRDADGEHEQPFAGCVIATPANHTRAIHTHLPVESAAFLDRIRYTPLLTANVGLTTPPPEQASFILTPRTLAPDVIGLILEHNKVPGRAPTGRGHIVIGASAELSRGLWDASDEQVTTALIEAAQPVLPLQLDDVELGHIARWPAVSLISPPGYYRELARFQAEHDARYARIRLASDYFCTSNVNSATAAGERAAHGLAERLRATAGRVRAAT